VLTYVNNEESFCVGSTPREVSILVDCDPSVVSSLVDIDEVSLCKYVIHMKSKYACPKNPPPLVDCGIYIASDGTRYNTSGLTISTGYSATGIDKYQYYWNFCKNVASSSCEFTAPAFQVSATGLCYVTGNLPGFLGDHPLSPKQGFTLTYVNDINQCFGDISRITRIIVACDNSVQWVIVSAGEPSRCTYEIQMKSKFACPSLA